MKITIIDDLSHVCAEQWNSLQLADNPFVRHEFLSGLEQYHCLGHERGWQPCHIVIHDEQDQLIAAAPSYLKSHSWGEFVFDWAWADAYERAGEHYYPKLIIASPFSPVTGPRLLIHPSHNQDQLQALLLTTIIEFAQQQQLSSVHNLFHLESGMPKAPTQHWHTRPGYQFHWHNQNYTDFDHFLSHLSSSKRKNIRKERRKVANAAIELRVFHDLDIQAEQMAIMHQFYSNTCHEKNNMAWLTADFFEHLRQTLAQHLVLVLAYKDKQAIAGSLCFRNKTQLWGRYWGSNGNYDGLHFETCYYRPLEYCIEQGIQHFEPGAQGEHKISRGFLPTPTRSSHWIADAHFNQAIGQHLVHERKHTAATMAALSERSPFKQQ